MIYKTAKRILDAYERTLYRRMQRAMIKLSPDKDERAYMYAQLCAEEVESEMYGQGMQFDGILITPDDDGGYQVEVLEGVESDAE